MRRWVAVLLVGSFQAAALAQAGAQTLQRAVEAAEALGARTGVAVCDADGSVLWRHRAGEVFAPASNMKLLTAAAVVDGLGADFLFTTTFRLRAGRLLVEASGDPNWIEGTPHAPDRVFAVVARALQRLGVRSLAGIDLDAGTFVGPARPATWPQDQLYTYYCAPTGAFVVEQGTFAVRIEAGGAGHADATVVAPAVAMPMRGAIELVDRARNAAYGASDRGDAVHVNGRFPRKGNPVTIRAAVAEPERWYLTSLQQTLATAGIAVGGAAATVADQVVHTHRSELRAAVLRMLEDSSNFDAEQCLRVLGAKRRHDGSLAGGVAALHDQVAALVGRLPAGAVFADGSGLSKQNRLSPGMLAVALVRMHGKPTGALLRACLPVAGQSGTLADRFTGTDLVGRVRAKTGWIRGASSLSGLVERRDGGVRYFAILMNYDPKTDGLNKDLKQLQEDIVRAIDRMDAAR